MRTLRKFLLGLLTILFVVYESVMFYLIHFKRIDSNYTLHYSCIIAATAFSLLTLIAQLIAAKDENQSPVKLLLSLSNGNLIRLAMIFTVIADYYLVCVAEDMSLQGVSVFLGTQFSIFLHIIANDRDKRWRKIHLITRFAMMAIFTLIPIILLGNETDILSVISVIYYANLCANAIFAHRSGRGGILLTIGLILFALCDVNVGLAALELIYGGSFPEGSFLYEVMNTDIDLIWLFYIPSQTLIPLTLLLCKKERLE
jgi:hypothetical protein